MTSSASPLDRRRARMAAPGELSTRPRSPAVAPGPRGARPAGLRRCGPRALSDGAEEFFSWLAVERGRAELDGRARTGATWLAYEATLAERGTTVDGRRTARRRGPPRPRSAPAGTAPASIARAQLGAARACTSFLVDEGIAPTDPTAELDGTRAARAGSPRR